MVVNMFLDLVVGYFWQIGTSKLTFKLSQNGT